jgi:hypothetical protein
MTSFSQPAFISDADDGDEYLMQVVYESIYTAFTGTVYTYHISKEDTVLSEEEILGSKDSKQVEKDTQRKAEQDSLNKDKEFSYGTTSPILIIAEILFSIFSLKIYIFYIFYELLLMLS